MDDLNAFAMAIDGDQALKDRVAAAESPEAVIQIAQAAGFNISLSQLKQAAPDLSASYWSWSGNGFRYRAQFFKS